MKKFILSIIIVAGGVVAGTANAQVGVNVGVRIGPLVINVNKPVAPAVVYDDFYYLPDVDAYYSVPEHVYYYMDSNRRWVSAAYLPGRYHDYDWRYARRYEVRTQRPFNNHEYYRNKFGGNRGADWNSNPYANRGNQRYDNNRSNDRRFDSPYDSNNDRGRGNYNQPEHRNDNSNHNYDDNRNNGYKDNRSNNQPQRDTNSGNNRGNSNSRGNYQRPADSNSHDSRPQFTSIKRVSF